MRIGEWTPFLFVFLGCGLVAPMMIAWLDDLHRDRYLCAFCLLQALSGTFQIAWRIYLSRHVDWNCFVFVVVGLRFDLKRILESNIYYYSISALRKVLVLLVVHLSWFVFGFTVRAVVSRDYFPCDVRPRNNIREKRRQSNEREKNICTFFLLMFLCCLMLICSVSLFWCDEFRRFFAFAEARFCVCCRRRVFTRKIHFYISNVSLVPCKLQNET